jgi:hypothetical protein
MKIAKLFVCLAAVSVVWAGAAERYKVSLGSDASVAGTVLPKGEYQLDIDGDTATLHNKKNMAKGPVKMEEDAQKHDSTMIRYRIAADGKYSVQEILLRGTKTKVVFP